MNTTDAVRSAVNAAYNGDVRPLVRWANRNDDHVWLKADAGRLIFADEGATRAVVGADGSWRVLGPNPAEGVELSFEDAFNKVTCWLREGA